MSIANMEKLTLVKVGGKIVEDDESLQRLLANFSTIAGNKILVHGGGRSATKIAENLGIEGQMVDGRRITDTETLKVVTMVYAGLVNKNIVAKLQAHNINALGLTGADMNVILSDKRPVNEIDYGFVGDVRLVNAEALIDILKENIVPVLSPITHDGKGNLLNTNADTIAGEVAKTLSYDYDVTLIYCFEKKGVLKNENDDNSIIPEINVGLFKQYVEEGIINRGMIPKLENAFQALNFGVKTIIITEASEICTGKGTYITKN